MRRRAGRKIAGRGKGSRDGHEEDEEDEEEKKGVARGRDAEGQGERKSEACTKKKWVEGQARGSGGGISRADLPSCGEMADHHHRRIIREPNNIFGASLLSIRCKRHATRTRVKKLPTGSIENSYLRAPIDF